MVSHGTDPQYIMVVLKYGLIWYCPHQMHGSACKSKSHMVLIFLIMVLFVSTKRLGGIPCCELDYKVVPGFGELCSCCCLQLEDPADDPHIRSSGWPSPSTDERINGWRLPRTDTSRNSGILTPVGKEHLEKRYAPPWYAPNVTKEHWDSCASLLAINQSVSGLELDTRKCFLLSKRPNVFLASKLSNPAAQPWRRRGRSRRRRRCFSALSRRRWCSLFDRWHRRRESWGQEDGSWWGDETAMAYPNNDDM